MFIHSYTHSIRSFDHPSIFVSNLLPYIALKLLVLASEWASSLYIKLVVSNLLRCPRSDNVTHVAAIINSAAKTVRDFY